MKRISIESIFTVSFIISIYMLFSIVVFLVDKEVAIIMGVGSVSLLLGSWVFYGINYWLTRPKRKYSNEYKLLCLLRDNIEILLDPFNCENGRSGLCGCVKELERACFITESEYEIIMALLYDNRPKGEHPHGYWWTPHAIKPRMKFVKQLIKKYKYEKS